MAKNRLSHIQKRRVEDKHNKRLQQNNDDSYQETDFLPQQDGTIVSRFGKVADVQNEDKQVFRCHIRRTLNSLVTGDKVVWRENVDPKNNGVIEALYPRETELVRPDFYDGIKTVAANINQIFIISSVVPEFSLNIIDRYLVACAATNIKPIIVLNKIDLLSIEERTTITNQLAYYQKLGFTVLFISCKEKSNLDELKSYLKGKLSILVGQSGVGKSSIIHELLPELSQTVSVGDVSSHSGLGQHTTTATRLYNLTFGGQLIDSPGIREFGLWHLEPEKIMAGFREFYDYLGDCQFRDCNHRTDLNCGLQKAVKDGKIAPWRLEHYLSILQTMQEIKAKTNKTYK